MAVRYKVRPPKGCLVQALFKRILAAGSEPPTFASLQRTAQEKFELVGTSTSLQFRYEDAGEPVLVADDEDVRVAFEDARNFGNEQHVLDLTTVDKSKKRAIKPEQADESKQGDLQKAAAPALNLGEEEADDSHDMDVDVDVGVDREDNAKNGEAPPGAEKIDEERTEDDNRVNRKDAAARSAAANVVVLDLASDSDAMVDDAGRAGNEKRRDDLDDTASVVGSKPLPRLEQVDAMSARELRNVLEALGMPINGDDDAKRDRLKFVLLASGFGSTPPACRAINLQSNRLVPREEAPTTSEEWGKTPLVYLYLGQFDISIDILDEAKHTERFRAFRAQRKERRGEQRLIDCSNAGDYVHREGVEFYEWCFNQDLSNGAAVGEVGASSSKRESVVRISDGDKGILRHLGKLMNTFQIGSCFDKLIPEQECTDGFDKPSNVPQIINKRGLPQRKPERRYRNVPLVRAVPRRHRHLVTYTLFVGPQIFAIPADKSLRNVFRRLKLGDSACKTRLLRRLNATTPAFGPPSETDRPGKFESVMSSFCHNYEVTTGNGSESDEESGVSSELSCLDAAGVMTRLFLSQRQSLQFLLDRDRVSFHDTFYTERDIGFGNFPCYLDHVSGQGVLEPPEHPSFGAMLCDDTGFGKTLVVLSLIAVSKASIPHTLVVVPQSLVPHWMQQAKEHLKKGALRMEMRRRVKAPKGKRSKSHKVEKVAVLGSVSQDGSLPNLILVAASDFNSQYSLIQLGLKNVRDIGRVVFDESQLSKFDEMKKKKTNYFTNNINKIAKGACRVLVSATPAGDDIDTLIKNFNTIGLEKQGDKSFWKQTIGVGDEGRSDHTAYTAEEGMEIFRQTVRLVAVRHVRSQSCARDIPEDGRRTGDPILKLPEINAMECGEEPDELEEAVIDFHTLSKKCVAIGSDLEDEDSEEDEAVLSQVDRSLEACFVGGCNSEQVNWLLLENLNKHAIDNDRKYDDGARNAGPLRPEVVARVLFHRGGASYARVRSHGSYSASGRQQIPKRKKSYTVDTVTRTLFDPDFNPQCAKCLNKCTGDSVHLLHKGSYFHMAIVCETCFPSLRCGQERHWQDPYDLFPGGRGIYSSDFDIHRDVYHVKRPVVGGEEDVPQPKKLRKTLKRKIRDQEKGRADLTSDEMGRKFEFLSMYPHIDPSLATIVARKEVAHLADEFEANTKLRLFVKKLESVLRQDKKVLVLGPPVRSKLALLSPLIAVCRGAEEVCRKIWSKANEAEEACRKTRSKAKATADADAEDDLSDGSDTDDDARSRVLARKLRLFEGRIAEARLREDRIAEDRMVSIFDNKDGSLLKGDEVARRVQAFQSNKDVRVCVVPLNDKVCCGLNLNAANAIILLTPPRLDSTEQQAIARAVRIGSKHKRVDVVRLYLKGTHEETVMQDRREKRLRVR